MKLEKKKFTRKDSDRKRREPNNNIENKFPHLKVNTEKLDDYHIIKGKRNMLKSRKASVRITDEYFYSGKGKVLKDQILFSKYLFKGESGTVSLNEDKTKITGLFFASNNNYSVFNNIDIAFKRIINRGKLGKITLNDIEIINQF